MPPHKSFPVQTQFDAMDCGPTCLAMIAKYYGRSYMLQNLRQRSFITRQGVSLLGVSDAAESIGFRTIGVKIAFDSLIDQAVLPCILHWNQNHFVVCYGIKRKKGSDNVRIQIADPVGEKYTMSKEEFLACWGSISVNGKQGGVALMLSPTPEFYRVEDDETQQKKNLRYYLRYFLPFKSQVTQLAVAMLLGSLIAMVLPFITQAVVDQGIANNNLSFVTLMLVAQLILTVTQTFVGFIRSWITLHMNTRISISLISDFLAKLMKLPINFFDTKNVGDIMQRIGDHSRIQDFLSGTTLATIFSFFNFLVFALILAYYNLTIVGVFVLGNALYLLWVFSFMKYRRQLDYNRFAQSSANQSNIVQMITGMQEIKLNNCERQERWKWERIQIKLFKINTKGVALGQYQELGTIFFSQVTSLIISFMAARAVITGEMTLGMMMSVSYIIGQLTAPIGQVIGFAQSLQDAKISLERLNEINNKEEEVVDAAYVVDEIPPQADLNIRNMSFSYDGAERDYVIHDLSVAIPRNKITAIVGESGSGKTTLIKMLLGFYAPIKGTIQVGTVLLGDINPHLWRQKTGAVMQDGFIFSDTIANNIAVGQEEIDKHRLRQAVDVANIRDFIESLPMKYNTKIGMDGSGISQGQRQRLLIARVVYKNPDFIFFDEATNALDANNEKVIMSNLAQFYKNKTVVVVAHRLSTVQHADTIIVLEKGVVVEQGTHHELTAKRGAYYTLVKNQLELGM